MLPPLPRCVLQGKMASMRGSRVELASDCNESWEIRAAIDTLRPEQVRATPRGALGNQSGTRFLRDKTRQGL